MTWHAGSLGMTSFSVFVFLIFGKRSRNIPINKLPFKMKEADLCIGLCLIFFNFTILLKNMLVEEFNTREMKIVLQFERKRPSLINRKFSYY